jgi:predicted ATPase/DNA-binding winged helix-turn-helix (wHTH) protein
MPRPLAKTREVLSFGPFRLVPNERLLTREDVPIELGARSFDVLVALVSQPNEILSKRDLLAQVWPDTVVDESSLRFHIASLRNALGDGRDGARYITTAAGRGYCFVAPISRSSDQEDASEQVSAGDQHATLPSRLTRMVGRADDTRRIADRLIASRFVTITGAGGVGKTTVAIAVAHDLINSFSGAVAFIDLSSLTDPSLVAPTVASMLGLSTDDATPSLIAYLREKRLLLILDTCEHLIDAAAALTSRIFLAGLQVHLLVTSRESLRVEGEHVYRLDPLECAPEDPTLTAMATQSFPAIQLFLERAAASGSRLTFNDAEAALVASICRKLDGMPLAIELAAGRVETYGLQRTAALLDERLTLMWQGQRNAPPRQKTLQATLNWSYELLSDVERAVLRRLVVFVGQFTLEAALSIVPSPTVAKDTVFGAIDSLVAKSIVAVRPVGAMMRYRLLDTTRAYILDVREYQAEFAELAERHAKYFRHWLDQTEAEWPTLSSPAERALRVTDLADVRAALDWCFGTGGNIKVGVELAASAARVFWVMSIYAECQRWAERALAVLDETTRGTSEEMHLQAALGLSLMFEAGRSEAVRAALHRSFEIAKDRGDAKQQNQLLAPLHLFHTREREFSIALTYATDGISVAGGLGDSTSIAVARTLRGISLHFTGELSGARAELEAALRHDPGAQWANPIFLASGHHIWAGTALARILWMQGFPDQAIECALRTIKQASDPDTSLSLALHWGCSVFLWSGDVARAKHHIDWYISRTETFTMGPNLTVGHGMRAALAIERGDLKDGVESLQRCMEKLFPGTYELHTELDMALIRGLSGLGRHAEALRLADESIGRTKANGDFCFMPELLRLKAKALAFAPRSGSDNAETYYAQSLELSHRQGATGWALRAATDLAALRADEGRGDDARELLLPLVDQFAEGHGTADLKAARRLLEALG